MLSWLTWKYENSTDKKINASLFYQLYIFFILRKKKWNLNKYNNQLNIWKMYYNTFNIFNMYLKIVQTYYKFIEIKYWMAGIWNI